MMLHMEKKISNDQVSESVKSEKIIKSEERYSELDRRIMQKPKVQESQGTSTCKEAESKRVEEQCWTITELCHSWISDHSGRGQNHLANQ